MPPTHIQSVTIKPEQKKLALTTQHIPAISQTREVTQAPVIEERTAVTAIANEPLVINAHAPQSFALDNELFTAESINLTTAQAPAVEENEPITIGHEEFHMMHAYQELHETITNNWHPPAGLNPRKECIIVVTVDEKGSPESITIEQPSGVRVYDIAARLAVYHSTFPTELTKQTVRLHF